MLCASSPLAVPSVYGFCEASRNRTFRGSKSKNPWEHFGSKKHALEKGELGPNEINLDEQMSYKIIVCA